MNSAPFSSKQAQEHFAEFGVPAAEAKTLAQSPAARAMLEHIIGYNPIMQQFVLRNDRLYEEPFLIRKRREITALYGGGDFGAILCGELHGPACEACGDTVHGVTFRDLAVKWNISLPTLGELIWDHCKQLEE